MRNVHRALFHMMVAVVATPVVAAVAADSTVQVPNSTVAAPKKATFDRARYDRDVVQSKDLPNFHEVHPFLYRSGEPTEAGLLKAKKHGISTIIDLRSAGEGAKAANPKEEAELAKKHGLTYINLPMSSKSPTEKQVATVMDAIKTAQSDPSKGAVLVHCAHGSDRTGCLVGIYRVTADKWKYEDAYKEMRHYWFTPKFTELSGAVKKHSEQAATKAK